MSKYTICPALNDPFDYPRICKAGDDEFLEDIVDLLNKLDGNVIMPRELNSDQKFLLDPYIVEQYEYIVKCLEVK